MRALGDVLAQIADALQVAGNAQHRHDMAQVVGQRLALGDHQDRQLLDVALQRVDGAVAGGGGLGELRIALFQGLEALRHQALHQAAHLGDLLVELAKLLVIGFDDVLLHGVPWLGAQPGVRWCDPVRSNRCGMTHAAL